MSAQLGLNQLATVDVCLDRPRPEPTRLQNQRNCSHFIPALTLTDGEFAAVFAALVDGLGY
jgi:hypothetical protein